MKKTLCSKQGMVMSTVVKMVLFIIVLVLVLLMFFVGPEALFIKIKSIVPRADQYIEKENAETRDDITRSAQESAQAAFDQIVTTYTLIASNTQETCFHYLDKDLLHDVFRNGKAKDVSFSISFQKTKDDYVMWLLRDIPNIDGTTKDSPVANVAVQGFTPCLVYGTAQANAFVNNWLNGDETAVKKTGLSGHSQSFPRFDLRQWKVFMSTVTTEGSSVKEIPWETTKNNDYLLYKYTEGASVNICIFPAYGATFKKTCGVIADIGIIEKNCFNERKYYNNPKSLYEFIEDRRYPQCVI